MQGADGFILPRRPHAGFAALRPGYGVPSSVQIVGHQRAARRSLIRGSVLPQRQDGRSVPAVPIRAAAVRRRRGRP